MPVQIEGLESYLLVALVFMGLYFWVLKKLGVLKSKMPSMANAPIHSVTPDIIPKPTLYAGQGTGMTLPPVAESLPALEEAADEDFELLDDIDNILLKEAEKVVDTIQDVVKNIASNPPNPEEVTSKIRAVVNPYQLFNDTEYYGAINTFIALAVERDCGITLSSEDIKALWN